MESLEKASVIDLLTKLLRVLVERFLKPLWIVVAFFGLILLRNWDTIFNTLSSWQTPEYTLAKDYIAVILSFPTVVLILGLILLLRFASSIRIFLENSLIKGAAGLELDQKRQEQTQVVVEATIDSGESATILVSELRRFRSLDNLLVYNTKIALHWFYLQNPNGSSIINFTNSFKLQPEIINPDIEKSSIFNALLRNGLVEASGENYKVSSEGKEYLKYLGVVSR